MELYRQVRGQGAPLLMIHGIISDSSFFQDCGALLASEFRVITYDRRGYGRSADTEIRDFSMQAQAEDAAEILRAEAKEPAWILGNSAGGLVALELAQRHPELVRGMVLLEPSLGYVESERQKLQAWNRELNGYVASGKLKRALPAFSRAIGVEAGGGGSLEELRRSYQNLTAFLLGELNQVQHYLPPLQQLRDLRTPTVMAVTRQGRDSMFATSSQSAAELIGWETVLFPGHHNSARECPAEFADTLREVLRRMEGATCDR